MQVCMSIVCGVFLTSWLIQGNELGEKGAKALAPALKRLTRLNTLGLEGHQYYGGAGRV